MASTVNANSQWAQTLYNRTLTWESEVNQLLFFLRGDKNSMAPIIEIDDDGGREGLHQEFLFASSDKNPVPKGAGEPVIGYEASGREPHRFQILCNYTSPTDFVLTYGQGDQQRTVRDLAEEQIKQANDRTSFYFERSLMRQLAGDTRYNSGTTFSGLSHYADHRMSGMNEVTYYDTTHIGYADAGSGAALASAAAVGGDSSAILSDIQVAKYISKLTTRRFGCKWPLVKMSLGAFGSGYLVLTTAEGIDQIKFSDPDSKFERIDLAELAGSMGFDSSALSKTTAIRSVNDTIYVAHEMLPLALTGVAANATTPGTATIANCQTNIILGHRAALLWWMEGYTDGMHVQETIDREHNRESHQYHTGYGFKRLVVDDQSWGSALFYSYTAATTEDA
jgi:hypothetical protein